MPYPDEVRVRCQCKYNVIHFSEMLIVVAWFSHLDCTPVREYIPGLALRSALFFFFSFFFF